MGDGQRQAAVEELQERLRTPRQTAALIELIGRQTLTDRETLTEHAQMLHRMEEEARDSRVEARGLKAEWARVWDRVSFAFLFERVRLRKELRQAEALNRLLARIALDCLDVVFENVTDERRRLCALEERLGLPVGPRPQAKESARG